jgi:hypothetical protein
MRQGQQQFMPMQRQVQQMFGQQQSPFGMFGQPQQQMSPFGMPGGQPEMMGNPMGNMLQMFMRRQAGMAGQQPGMPGQQLSQGQLGQFFGPTAQQQSVAQNRGRQLAGFGQQQGGQGFALPIRQGPLQAGQQGMAQPGLVPGQQVDPALLQGMMRSRAAGAGQMPGMMQNLMSGLSFMQGVPGMGGQGFGKQFRGQQRFF